jgi:hypothetical protein
VTRFRSRFSLLVALAASAACGEGTGPGSTPAANCDAAEPTALSPGQLAVADASETACLRLGAAGAEGAEYLYVAYSAAGEETRAGTSAGYRLTGAGGGPAPAAVARPRFQGARRGATPTQLLHGRLREMGRDLARSHPGARLRTGPAVKTPPPVLGESRSFSVLRSAEASGIQPSDYVRVDATARHVGAHSAIFIDDAAPAEGGYTQADIDAIGSLFDDYLYTIAVNAFGAESDVNGDGMVLVLLTNRVTRLAGCDGSQFVVGLFFAVDLIAGHVGSNNAEIFYGLAPDPDCGVDRARAVRDLPAVFIHEFQHMINYGQHVLARDGEAEDTWLDEGLSGLAEELGGRLVPDGRCVADDCLTQFHASNLVNAYDYLAGQDASYLIGPRQPPLPLTQYGATWLFVRWLMDHFAEEPTLGDDLTRALVQSTQTGADNVAGATGVPFDRLIGEWQLANYLDDHPEFESLTAGTRLRYSSWSLREVFASFHENDPANFPRDYPLLPDVLSGGDYLKTGVLRAGSGRHLLVEQAAAGEPLDLLLTRTDGAGVLSPDVAPRTAVLRLR